MKKEGVSLYGTVANRLIQLRKSLGLTRPQMARRLGVTDNAYGKNENGQTLPGYHSLHRLSNELGVSMDWLFFGKGEMYFQDNTATLPALPGAEPSENALTKDIRAMLTCMEKIPELHYSMMLYYHNFRKENPALFPGTDSQLESESQS